MSAPGETTITNENSTEPRRPSQDVINVIRDNFIPISADHPRINQAIEDTDAEILCLTKRLDMLKEFSAQQKCLVSPIRRIPNELLAAIFQETCAANDNEITAPNGALNALAISHTCIRWRRVSLACPSMWSYISIDLPEEYWDHRLWRSYPTKLLDHFNTRRQSSPFHVEIYCTAKFQLRSEGLSEGAHNWLYEIIATSPSWASLGIWANVPEVVVELLEQGILDLPQLESLFFHDWEGNCNVSWLINAVSMASPRLCILQTGESELGDGELHCAQLKEIEVRMDPSNVRVLANSCTTLEKMVIPAPCGHNYCHSRRLPECPITFSNLHTLQVKDDKGSFFPFLTLPSLKVLEIGAAYYRSNKWAHFDFLAMFGRAQFHLSVLTLEEIDISEDQLLEILDLAASTLTALAYIGCPNVGDGLSVKFAQKFFLPRELSDLSRSTPFLPSLRSLEVSDRLKWDRETNRALFWSLTRRGADLVPDSVNPGVPKDGRLLKKATFKSFEKDENAYFVKHDREVQVFSNGKIRVTHYT